MISEFDPNASYSDLYDFCIVGTGPAGITLAIKLANQNFSILLLEAGGLDYSNESQDFYECESVGHEGWPKLTRLRFFGGTSNHWSGRCRPFEASDFERQSINGLPGWPIGYAEVDTYLSKAMEIIDLDTEAGFQPINDDLLRDQFSPDASTQSRPTRFKTKYIETVRNHDNIHCLYNATAIDMALDDKQTTAQSILVSDYSNKKSRFTAKKFILCLGGIETPRFLLNCKSQIADGIGNSHDMMGRCFMEHLNVPLGSFIYRNPDDYFRMQFSTDADFAREASIGHSNVTLGIVQTVRSYGRTKAIKNFFKNLACQLDVSEKVQYLSTFKCPGMGNISTLMEQSPNLNSRVTLSDQKDSMGLQRARFDWQINDYDRRTIRSVGLNFAKQFEKSKLGKVKLNEFVISDDPSAIPFSRHCHHMGTTRMSKAAKDGVVDENCRVHGVDNLFIAGSSVFSTGGACNPTMPIIQLCLRLADHLSS